MRKAYETKLYERLKETRALLSQPTEGGQRDVCNVTGLTKIQWRIMRQKGIIKKISNKRYVWDTTEPTRAMAVAILREQNKVFNATPSAQKKAAQKSAEAAQVEASADTGSVGMDWSSITVNVPVSLRYRINGSIQMDIPHGTPKSVVHKAVDTIMDRAITENVTT